MSKLVQVLSSVRQVVFRLESRLIQVLGSQSNQGWPPLGYDVATVDHQVDHGHQQRSLLDIIRDNAILWAVPKKRRSLERRMMRRMGRDKIKKFLTPKKNIIECLECGHWHEAHTICGNCYNKVRDETVAMQNSMPENERLANIPQTEVVYLYEDEVNERSKHDGKYIVDVEKKRPDWWPKNLLTKASRW